MRTSILLLLFGCAIAFGAEPTYRLSQLRALRSQSAARTILIPKIEFREALWSDILRELERLSLQHDPTKKGVRIFVPDRFKADFASIAATRYTVQLGPSITLDSAFTEMPPPGWLYYPTSAREVAVIPQSAVIEDLTK
ncbi:MAG: hypothetical protein ABMA01_19120 [Chthoniobacteraceae bacterium]